MGGWQKGGRRVMGGWQKGGKTKTRTAKITAAQHTFEIIDVQYSVHPAAAGTCVWNSLQHLHQSSIGGPAGLHPYQ